MPIPLVFITDEKYSMPTSVAITSLISNKLKDTAYSIYILADCISKDSEYKFKKMKTDDVTISIINMDEAILKKIGKSNVPDSIHVSRAALYKFQIPNLFPDIEKIIYLDGDVLVKSDLTDLYSIDLSGKYAATVDDMKAMIGYQPSQMVKLGISNFHYFNTGMMLLNLKELRNNNVSTKLEEYRISGINYFMDQDAFNVVFENHILPIDFKFNLTYSNYEYYSFNDLKTFYKFKENTAEELLDNVQILHLSSKQKPWLYSDMAFTNEWDKYHYKSPFYTPLDRKSIVEEKDVSKICVENTQLKEELHKIKNSFSYKLGLKLTYFPRIIIEKRKKYRKMIPHYCNGINHQETREKKIIVSLTSYPSRDHVLPKTLESLLKQTMKPDKIEVYLSISQYPSKKITRRLKNSRRFGVDFIFVNDDLKPHKKYYYSIQNHPDDIVITVDDDVYYAPKTIERLYRSYLSHPTCVSASRVHKITFDKNGLMPYNRWQKQCTDCLGKESMRLIATGVGGVLYPPHCLPKETFDKIGILSTCLYADDLWLKIMEVINGTKVVLASKDKSIDIIDGSQNNALWKDNVDSNKNDKQLEQILEYIGNRKNSIIKQIVNDTGTELEYCDYCNYVPDTWSSLSSIKDLNTYFEILEALKQQIIITIVAKDTVHKYWDNVQFPSFFGKIKNPGYRKPFSAIIDFSNNCHIINYGDKYCMSTYENCLLSIKAISYGYEEKNSSYIIIDNGKKWMYSSDSNNNRGLFIVVYSKIEDTIIDFIRADLHKDKDLKINHM